VGEPSKARTPALERQHPVRGAMFIARDRYHILHSFRSAMSCLAAAQVNDLISSGQDLQSLTHVRAERSYLKIRYIMNQERHHRRRSFRDEYLTLLRKFEIEFKEEYVFEFYD
jgi:hypothetical protein